MSKELVASYEGELPIGWELATIGELITPEGVFIDGDWVESKDQDPNGDVRLLQLADIGDGFYKNKSSRFLTKDKAEELNCTFLKKGDVLLARMPDPLGRACIFPGDEKDCVTVVDVCVIRSGTDEVGHKWLMYWVNSPKFRNTIASLQSGTTRRRISRGNLATITFPVPPPEQQKRIVAKIEELFSHIDAGIAALNKSKKLLKQYRQSVLKAAVTGELTKQWREENKDKPEPASELLERILKERREKWEAQQLAQFEAKGKMPKNDKWKEKYKVLQMPDTEDLPDIPMDWQWASLEHVFDVITDGDHQAPPKADTGVPFLVIGDVNKGILTFGDTRFVPQKYYDSLADIRKPVRGDILYTVVGSYGIPVKVDQDVLFCVQRHIAILKPNKSISIDYLFHVLSSGFIYKQATDVATGTAQKTVPLGGLRTIKIPLPPFKEQVEIADEISQKIDQMERTDQEASKKLLLAEKNKQAILASAFSGNLVDQLETDGSAKDLIEKITSEVNEAKKYSKKSKTKRVKKKANSPMKKRSLLSVLEEHVEGVSPDNLMQEAGFLAEEVDEFYQELSEIGDRLVEDKLEDSEKNSWPYDSSVKLKLKDK